MSGFERILARMERRKRVLRAWADREAKRLGPDLRVASYVVTRGPSRGEHAYLHPSFHDQRCWEVHWMLPDGTPYGHTARDTIAECLQELLDQYGQRIGAIRLEEVRTGHRGPTRPAR